MSSPRYLKYCSVNFSERFSLTRADGKVVKTWRYCRYGRCFMLGRFR